MPLPDDDPVNLDNHRGMTAQKETLDRREKLQAFQDDQRALQRRQEELEAFLLAEPAENWPAVAAKAEYLIRLFSDTPQAQDPRRKKLIATVLGEIEELNTQRQDD